MAVRRAAQRRGFKLKEEQDTFRSKFSGKMSQAKGKACMKAQR